MPKKKATTDAVEQTKETTIDLSDQVLNEIIRVQLDFTPDQIKKIETAMKQYGIKTRKEFFMKAQKLYLLLQSQAGGDEYLTIYKGKEKIIIFL